MREVMTLIARAATMRAGVLIRGEDGTGRQVGGARDSRAAAAGAAGAFVARRLRARYDTDELDVELFGAGRRARRTAIAAARPRARQPPEPVCTRRAAARSTCRTSPKRRRACRRGSRACCAIARRCSSKPARPIGFDVRPMAGVDPAFDSAVQEGRVRDDLFRRLSVIRIDMPPLRSRREDIPALANYFLREICAVAARAAEDAVASGAVADLGAAVARQRGRAAAAARGDRHAACTGGRGIALEDVLGARPARRRQPVLLSSGGTLKQARVAIRAGVHRRRCSSSTTGRISDAAKALGIQRTNLYRKMRLAAVSRAGPEILRRRRSRSRAGSWGPPTRRS